MIPKLIVLMFPTPLKTIRVFVDLIVWMILYIFKGFHILSTSDELEPKFRINAGSQNQDTCMPAKFSSRWRSKAKFPSQLPEKGGNKPYQPSLKVLFSKHRSY